MISRTKKNEQNDMLEAPEGIEDTNITSIRDPLDNPQITEKDDALDKRFAAMEASLAEANRRNDELARTNLALMSTPLVNTSNFQQQPQKVELPDPLSEPEKYAEAVASMVTQRTNDATTRQNQEATRRQDLEERVEDLWGDFGEKYPDYAEDQEKIEFAAARVLKRAKRRGVDVERYMFTSSDLFMKDVAGEMEKVFGEPEKDNTEDDTTPRRGSTRRASGSSRKRDSEEDFDEGRSAGIFGGQDSGNSPGRARTEKETPSMMDDLMSVQKKLGIY